jgi:hypothetical protein
MDIPGVRSSRPNGRFNIVFRFGECMMQDEGGVAFTLYSNLPTATPMDEKK